MPRRKPPQDTFNLKDKPYWRTIKLQFNNDELELIIVLWNQFIAQFKEDVLPTEEMQVLDLIKIDVLLNRLMKAQNDTMDKIQMIEALVTKMKNDGDVDEAEISIEEMQKMAYRKEYDNMAKEIRETLKEKSKLLEQLKATRAARFQKIDGKQTFGLWFKQINEDVDLRKEIGLSIEKMRLASEAEKLRLGQYHKFANGEFDRPFLTPDTVGFGDKDSD
jgi:hypothetical protein